MALKAGTSDDMANSMAAAMEAAMAEEWQQVKGEPLPEMGEADRRLLFVAIAQGVIRHLKDFSEGAYAIDVDDTDDTAEIVSIATTGELY